MNMFVYYHLSSIRAKRCRLRCLANGRQMLQQPHSTTQFFVSDKKPDNLGGDSDTDYTSYNKY